MSSLSTTHSTRSFCAKASSALPDDPALVQPVWLHIDGTDQIVGRLAVKIATILMGKHKPTYTPHVACGDFVVVTNAEKVRFTGASIAHPTHKSFTAKFARKEYQSYSGYPGGQKTRTGAELLATNPTFILREAVRRMLPKNRLQRVMLSRLKLYAGESHPHQAQRPQPVDVD